MLARVRVSCEDSREAVTAAYSKVESSGCVRKGSSVEIGCAMARMRQSVLVLHRRMRAGLAYQLLNRSPFSELMWQQYMRYRTARE